MPKGYPRIPRQSDRRRKIYREYSKLRLAFLAENPKCELCPKLGRDTPHGNFKTRPRNAIHIHHKKGRGKYELVQATWAALCEECHRYIHDHPAWSYANGYLINRATPLS